MSGKAYARETFVLVPTFHAVTAHREVEGPCVSPFQSATVRAATLRGWGKDGARDGHFTLEEKLPTGAKRILLTRLSGVRVKFCFKNALIAVGAYWLSTWTAVPLGMLFGKITNHIIYGDSLLAAILIGLMLSLGRSVAAAAAGICVALVADGKNPEFWAIIPSVLYATRLFRYHFHTSPTTWDYVWVNVERFFPAVVCVAAAFLVARVGRRQKG